MRKGRDGGKKTGKKPSKKTDENSGHYVIASSRPPERWNAARSRQLNPLIDGLGRQGGVHEKSLQDPFEHLSFSLSKY